MFPPVSPPCHDRELALFTHHKMNRHAAYRRCGDRLYTTARHVYIPSGLPHDCSPQITLKPRIRTPCSGGVKAPGRRVGAALLRAANMKCMWFVFDSYVPSSRVSCLVVGRASEALPGIPVVRLAPSHRVLSPPGSSESGFLHLLTSALHLRRSSTVMFYSAARLLCRLVRPSVTASRV